MRVCFHLNPSDQDGDAAAPIGKQPQSQQPYSLLLLFV
jgi:hypothetical protein